jgi:hypothetical protein
VEVVEAGRLILKSIYDIHIPPRELRSKISSMYMLFPKSQENLAAIA